MYSFIRQGVVSQKMNGACKKCFVWLTSTLKLSIWSVVCHCQLVSFGSKVYKV